MIKYKGSKIRKKEKDMYNQKAMTMITLIITIILLIILASVTLNTIIGENGIIL